MIEMTKTAWLMKLGLWDHVLIHIREPKYKLMYLEEFDVVVLDNLRSVKEQDSD